MSFNYNHILENPVFIKAASEDSQPFDLSTLSDISLEDFINTYGDQATVDFTPIIIELFRNNQITTGVFGAQVDTMIRSAIDGPAQRRNLSQIEYINNFRRSFNIFSKSNNTIFTSIFCSSFVKILPSLKSTKTSYI